MMKIFLLQFSIMLLAACAAIGDEPLKVWSYASLKETPLYAAKGNEASMRVSPDVKAPDGQSSLEVSLKTLNPDAVPWDVQLKFIYDGGLKAGRSYELSFPCKASDSGALQMAVAQAESPWEILPGSNSSVDVTKEWQTVKLSFIAKKDWTGPLAIPRMMLAKYGAAATLYFGPASLRELPKMLPLALDKEWSLFLGVKAPDGFASIPGDIGGVKAQHLALQSNSINLAQLSTGFKAQDCAMLYNQFDSAEAGRMRVGVSADWWLELYINGEKLYSNIPAGNNSNAFTPDDHVLELPVKAGRNVLAAKVLAGSAGWRFVCGAATRAPDDLRLFIVKPGNDWKPVDMDRLQVKPGTALDFSALAGERRLAGELGRLIVSQSGRLAFEKEPARSIRFLSYNSSLSYWRAFAHTWTKKDIEEYVDGVARLGYNMLRLHYNDRFLLGFKVHDKPNKSMKETGIPQKAEDIQFDAGNVDRFDYFFACLKKNGIYSNLDLMSGSTGYSMAYPGKDPPERSFRIQLFFNPEYRRHWEVAVEHLLNHVNPYTGMKLKDDPALAIVEPFNEQDLHLDSKPAMKEFTPFFQQHLKAKYQTDDALRKAWAQPAASLESVPDIDEALLRKGDARAEDAGSFLIKSMREMTGWYYGVIRKNGYTGLVTQWDMIMRTMEMPVRAELPVIAQHSYFAHPNESPTKNLVPKGPNSMFCGGKDKDIMVGQESSLNSSYFRAAAAVRFLDRPFMITEYSHSSFNRYRHERGLYFGSYAALQGWDSLAAHGALTAFSKASKQDPFMAFENAQDPISRASETVAALAWLRGDVKEAPHSVQLNLSSAALFPKNYLSAIGDDYAKLSMLTKIGIVYPEIKPLAPVGASKPDIEITPTEFSPLSVSQWYVSASSADGKLFPALLRKLAEMRILPASNQTDYAKRLYQSETGEITLDGRAETMTVVTPRLEGAIVKKDQPVKLKSLEIESCSKPASIVVASLDRDKPIADSKHLLLVFATNALNNGMTFENASMLTMAEVGSLPVLMETAKLSIRLKSSLAGKPAAYALNLDGTRAEQIACEVKDGSLALSIDTKTLNCGTPFFEIECR